TGRLTLTCCDLAFSPWRQKACILLEPPSAQTTSSRRQMARCYRTGQTHQFTPSIWHSAIRLSSAATLPFTRGCHMDHAGSLPRLLQIVRIDIHLPPRNLFVCRPFVAQLANADRFLPAAKRRTEYPAGDRTGNI